jgi:Mg-chelatase subunit ChlI
VPGTVVRSLPRRVEGIPQPGVVVVVAVVVVVVVARVAGAVEVVRATVVGGRVIGAKAELDGRTEVAAEDVGTIVSVGSS